MTPPQSSPPSSTTVCGVSNCRYSYNNHHTQNKFSDHHHSNARQGSSSNNQNPNRKNPFSRREIVQLKGATRGSSGAAKINDIVGNGISGILNKWVNYGKGWRPRWFVLQDGVLSYYKIHGPDKIVLSPETDKWARLIGEESLKRVSKSLQKNTLSSSQKNPVGEVHLKVSSIRESRSDDKIFSIFTGTKRLYLRAESREDRLAWMEALQAVKDMFPRMSNSDLMAPMENFVVSTEKLRQRLMGEGVSEAAILDSEQIMRKESTSLQNQLMSQKQKHWLLIDTLRQLETGKVDLENTGVEESQRKLTEG